MKSRSASRRAEAAVSLEALRIGDVIRIPAGRRAGWAVVVQPARTGKGAPTGPAVVTEDKQFRRLTLVDVPEPVEAVTHVKVPPHFNPKSPKSPPRPGDHACASPCRTGSRTRRAVGPARSRPPSRSGWQRLRAELKAHPCHQCPDRETHARWAERWWRLKRETVGLQRKVEGRTNTVARTFDRICEALEARGYLADGGTVVTERGERLRRLYTEKDLLAAECLRHDVWKRLDAAGLAAAVSALIHEPRHEEAEVSPRMPNDEVAEALTRDGAALVRDRGPRDRARPAHDVDARRRHGVDGAPLGVGGAARRRAARPGHRRR